MEGSSIWEIIFKCFATLLGVMFVYLSLLYEDEEKKIKNWFIDAWLQLDQADKTFSQRTNGVFTNYHIWVEGFIDRLFGPELLSKLAIFVSYCASIISLYAVLIFYHISVNLEKIFNEGVDAKLLLKLGVGVAQIVVTKNMIKLAAKDEVKFRKNFRGLMIVVGTMFLLIATTFRNREVDSLLITAYLILMPLFVGTSILFFAGIRLISRRMKQNSTLLIKLLLFVVSMTFLGIFSYPIWSMGIGNPDKGFSYAFFASASNAYIFLIAATYVLLMCFYFLNFLLWNLFKRPIYALQKNDVLKYKRIFTLIGVALLGYAWKDGADWVGRFFK